MTLSIWQYFGMLLFFFLVVPLWVGIMVSVVTHCYFSTMIKLGGNIRVAQFKGESNGATVNAG